FRATGPDDFHLAYAAALASTGGGEEFAKANHVVSGTTERRAGWRAARWLAVVINYRAERWSDVVKLLTPMVNDPDLDEAFSHAAKITLGTALARLGMFAPALSYLEEPDGPVAVAAVDGALAKALVLRAHVDEESASEVCRTCRRPPRNEIGRGGAVGYQLRDRHHHAGRIEARTDPWDPATEPGAEDFVDPRPTNARPRCCTRPNSNSPSSSASTRSNARCRG
ncbi:hypothetical protein ABLN64_13615, partial [Mycobacterium tuberculosis]